MSTADMKAKQEIKEVDDDKGDRGRRDKETTIRDCLGADLRLI